MWASPIQAENIAKQNIKSQEPIAYLVSRFPRLTETFILREIIELKKRGRPVAIYPLLSVRQSIHHAETGILADQVHYTPYFTPKVLAANLKCLTKSPNAYLRILFCTIRNNWSSFYLLSRVLILFPKSVFIAKLVAASGVRHVHAHFATFPALTAMIIYELTGINYSFTAHAHDIFVHTAMLREKLSKARFVITISEYNKRYLLRLFPDIPDGKIHVVHCGVEPEQYSQAPPGSSPEKQKRLRILCVASLQRYKGIEVLIHACKRLRDSVPEFDCRIIGDGGDRRKLLALIWTLGLKEQVQLLGPRKQDEIGELLGQADLFVLPSVVAPNGQMEGIPVALMEAMASGLPVVASQLSGIPELVEHGKNGLLVPPGDEIALSKALEFLCLNDGTRIRFGRHGREKVAGEFDLRDNVSRLNALFNAAPPTDSIILSKNPLFPRKLARDTHPSLRQRPSEPKPLDLPPSVKLLNSLYKGRDSVIYAVQFNGSDERSILKKHKSRKDSPGADLRARREFNILSHLAETLPLYSSRFRVPEVLAFFPENQTLILSECPGETFDHHLRWGRLRRGRSRESLIRGVEDCGEWLSLFHVVTSRKEEKLPEVENEIQSSFRRDLHQCSLQGLDSGILSQAAECFSLWSRSAFISHPEFTGHHGDYGPHNIFWHPECTRVIDLEGFRIGFPFEDVADFLVLINLLPLYHADAPLRSCLRTAFLRGYTKHYSLDIESLRLFELQALVKRMAHNPQLAGSEAGKFWERSGRLQRSYRKYFKTLLS